MHETTFPDSADILINAVKIKEFAPLQHKSSLKKRKDDKIQLKDVSIIIKGQNILELKEVIHS